MKKSDDYPYRTLYLIGEGSYAKVHKAINRRTGEICAIKDISVSSDFKILKNEIDILSECNCKNIVRFLQSTCSDGSVSIVMEYCCGGSVKDVMRRLGRTLTQDQIIVITKDVLNGLDYLHSKNKMHRDVKAANILLNENGIAKLGDFGVSEPVIEGTARKKSISGTLLWLAPEVISGADYDVRIDIWSLGITIIEMAEGQPPYSKMSTREEALREIANVARPSPTFRDSSKWSQNLREFLSLCLDKEATRRKSASKLLKYEIIRNSPPNDVIKSIVSEVCLLTLNSSELKKNSYSKYQYLYEENGILLNILKERVSKILQFDQLAGELITLNENFEDSKEKIKNQNIIVDEMINQSNSNINEILKLERTINELETEVEKKRRENIHYKGQIDIMRSKITKDFDYDDSQRRRKLSLLKS